MFNPFSALRSTGEALIEEELKEVILTITSQLAGRLPSYITDAWELHGLFKGIQVVLDRIRKLAIDEMGNLPRISVLASLWDQLARADEYTKHRSHKELLEDLTGFYESLGKKTVETISALERIASELHEFCDEYASVKLVLKDFPLSVIMSTIRRSAERLELAGRMLERIEHGERRGTLGRASTRTVYATAAQIDI
ncbi:hypothetical protein MMC18_007259 [Xylographa bjoerkii]|nr:hypothetical protein [Xylographa bjoerkii]